MSKPPNRDNSRSHMSSGSGREHRSDSDSGLSGSSDEYTPAESTEFKHQTHPPHQAHPEYQYYAALRSDYSSQPSGYTQQGPSHYPSQHPSQYPEQYYSQSSSRTHDQYPSQSSSQYYSPSSDQHPLHSDQGGPFDGVVENAFLSRRETRQRMQYWDERATQGGYDADTHIVDPLAHYSWLEHLEEYVVRNSEYFQYRGELQCEDDRIPVGIDLHRDWLTNMLPSLRSMLPQDFLPSGAGIFGVNHAELRTSRLVLESLWKSYWILCKTMRSFDVLRSEGFCKDFYSMLVYHPQRDAANLIRISQDKLHALKTGIENAVTRVFRGDPEGSQFVLLSFVATQCDDILGSLNLLPRTQGLPIMTTCRATVLLLDLALVSYVGSHGSRFTSYIQSAAETISIRSNSIEMPPLSCGLKRLACLSEFLDNSKVWVFEIETEDSHRPSLHDRSPGLSVVTRIEEFADIWGPVWSVPADDGRGSQRYDLSRGCLQAIPGGNAYDVIDCHWFSPSYEPPQDDTVPAMASHALLSIGGALKKNTECIYTLDQYENDYGLTMGQLVNAGKTSKKLPGTTMKQDILNTFSRNPVLANIEVLNNFIGVEVSHCTGNARRVRMKDIFRLARVQACLSYYYGDWELTDWGAAFSTALQNDSDDALWHLWRQHRDMRQSIGEFVCLLLSLLSTTGQQDNCLLAAYFGPRNEHHQEIEVRGNEWAKCLRDSHKVAAFAVIGDTCLKYPTRNNPLGLCQPTYTETMYETRISFTGDLPSQSDYIRLEPLGLIFRVERIKRNKIMVLVPTDAQVFLRMLHPLTKSAVEVVARIGTRRSRKEFYALIKASTESYGGMRRPREQVDTYARDRPVPVNQQEQNEERDVQPMPFSDTGMVPPMPLSIPAPVPPQNTPRQPPRQLRETRGVDERKRRRADPHPRIRLTAVFFDGTASACS
ncbi:uncharacterized protein PAC_06719 [Phialocephala subalpina]|uniref:Uncharacterized protein n=1 Tax=Phialocephala subalpina TaxID=576137 RepID=A0A1L7WVM7_9HELO|nr:uncharacterized protein PAC_06719 [Phialocephala subalpina]